MSMNFNVNKNKMTVFFWYKVTEDNNRVID